MIGDEETEIRDDAGGNAGLILWQHCQREEASVEPTLLPLGAPEAFWMFLQVLPQLTCCGAVPLERMSNKSEEERK